MQLLQIVGVVCVFACNGHSGQKPTAIEFGPAVAPPFGLDALRGGESVDDARKALPALQSASSEDELVLADAKSGGVAHIKIDHGRVADIVFGFANCRGLEARVDTAWSQFRRGPETWSDPSTKWAASFVDRAEGCELRFTHAAYFGTRPAAFGAPADLKIGSSHGDEDRPAFGESTVPSHAVVGAMEGALVDRFNNVVGPYYVLPRRVVEALRLAWGPSSRVWPDKDMEWWNDPETRTNAALGFVNETSNTWTLQLSSYVPLRDWLGGGSQIAALPDDVWTTPLSKFASAHPNIKVDEETTTIILPPVEWTSADGTHATMSLDDHRVPHGAAVMLPFPNTRVRAEMLSVFEAKWGKPTGAKGRLTFESSPGVVIEEGENTFFVQVDRPARPTP